MAHSTQHQDLFVNIMSQNVQSFTDDKFAELVTQFKKKKLWAVCLQETKRKANDTKVLGGLTFINHSEDPRRGGVGFVLGRESKECWRKAGSDVYKFGDRIMAIRLEVEDAQKQCLSIYLVSAYAPTSEKSNAMKEEYHDQLSLCVECAHSKDIIIIGTDANARLGINNDARTDNVCGMYGNKGLSSDGLSVRTLFSSLNLCATNTFFQKKHYDSFKDHNGPRCIDYICVKHTDMKYIRDSGTATWYGIKSDHRAVILKLRIAKRLSQQHRHQFKRPKRYFLSALKDEEIRNQFHEKAEFHLERHGDKTARGGTDSDPSKRLRILLEGFRIAAEETLPNQTKKIPEWFEQCMDQLLPLIDKRNFARARYLQKKGKRWKRRMKKTARKVKQKVKEAKESWLKSVCSKINGRENTRPATQKEIWEMVRLLQRGPDAARVETIMKLRKGDGEMCRGQKELKETLTEYMTQVFSKTGSFEQSAVDKVKLRPIQTVMDKKPSKGELLDAVAAMKNNKAPGNDECPAEFFTAIKDSPQLWAEFNLVIEEFWQSGCYDVNVEELEEAALPDLLVLNEIPVDHPIKFQQGSNPYLWYQPADTHNAERFDRYNKYKYCETISAALHAGATLADLAEDLKKGFLTPHPFLPGVARTELDQQRGDDGGVVHADWLQSKLILIPKKGDLSNPKNWRPICLLNVASKILSKVLVRRLQRLYEQVGMDEQCGFRPERGTVDGIFNTMMALQKRKSTGLGTYAVFIDLVKAFDSISRKALFTILRRYGVPDHFLNILIRLHKGASFTIDLNGDKVEVDSNIGVRQGSNEGPVLFLFFMLAIIETMEWPASIKVPCFYSREAGPISAFGNMFKFPYENKKFEHFYSLFADDAAFNFESREDMVIGMEYLYKHLKSFGVDMHVGRGGEKSKTVAMYFPAKDEAGTTEPVTFLDENGDTCTVHFEDRIKYLGSYLSSEGTSQVDIEARLLKASQAFGALSSRITRRQELKKLKGMVYVSLVLNVLLYGCECWTMTSPMMTKLCSFHRRCVRRMCRTSTQAMSTQHVHHSDLYQRLGIHSLDYYYNSRVLRWAGHLARMPMSRRPRQFLTSGVPQRATAPGFKHWGNSLNKVLHSVGLPNDFREWTGQVGDRDTWRELVIEKILEAEEKANEEQ
jgi:exonuclease III